MTSIEATSSMNERVQRYGGIGTESDRQIADLARSLAVPVRIALLKILMSNESWVSVDVFPLSEFNPIIRDKHLQALCSLGIVKRRGENNVTVYCLNRDVSTNRVGALAEFLKFIIPSLTNINS